MYIRLEDANTVKQYLFNFSNFLSMMAGMSLFFLGGMKVFSNDDTTVIKDHGFTIVGIILIFMGLSIFIVTFNSFCGAFYEMYSILYKNGTFLTVLLVLQLIFSVIALYYRQKYSNEPLLKVTVENLFEKYDTHKNYQGIIDHIQQTNSCCGVTGPEFWESQDTKRYPPSCCSENSGKCVASNVYRHGCLYAIETYIVSNYHFFYIINNYSIVAQVLAIVSTFYYAEELRLRSVELIFI